MNKCQMSNNTNSSAPSSPAGKVAANKSTDQEVSDSQHPRLSRSRSLSDISQGDSPQGGDQQTQQAPQESLKVKIRTQNILNNNNTTAKDGNSDSNNITKNNAINNKPISGEGATNKTPVCSPNKVGKSKASKIISLASNNITSSKSSANSPKNQLENNIGENRETTSRSELNMNNHNDTNAPAENGKILAPPQPFYMQPLLQNPSLPPSTQPPQPQQQLQSQPTQSHPPPSLVQSVAQAQTSPAKQSPSSESSKTVKSPVTPTEPKPKATRTRKQPVASNKGANAQNATPKPETKRTKKAKQNAENALTTKSATVPSTQPLPAISTSTPDNKNAPNPQQSPTAPPAKKRKPRATASSSSTAVPINEPPMPTVSPPKRTRKKKGDTVAVKTDTNNNPPPTLTAPSINIPPVRLAGQELLSVTSNVPMGSSPLMPNVPMLPTQQPNINRPIGMGPIDAHDPANRYYSLTISPYANYDYGNAASLTRPSLSRLFTSSSADMGQTNSQTDELSKAFEDLRDNSWNHLSKCILEQAQQFDIPSLIGTLYTLRSENDKLASKVRDLTQKRDQLIAMNARLELPGSSLISHLSHTSPNFSSVVAGLTNSPKSLPISSPSPAMNKSPIVPGGSYNHLPPTNSLGPAGFIDRNSPLIGLQTPHSGVNSLKSSTISTPSPPTGALMAHGANNRASLMTVNNPPYVSNVHPSMNALNPLGGPNPPSSSYYPRQ